MTVDLRRRRLTDLADGVGGDAGVLPGGLRRDLVNGRGIIGDLGVLAELVAAGGLEVTDEHIRRLLVSGHSADAVFECVVAAAAGAGLERLRAVEQLLQDSPP
ncbi:MAG TPA: hypothetical protein VFN75_01255 [Pseudonocardiaceae bacterium]|nr:hypothetical protein [Pseudonocardiaceae bacterium]